MSTPTASPDPPSFVYSAFQDATTEIRLLTVRPGSGDDTVDCTLQHVPLENAHTCLSYTWGPDSDHKTILVNGFTFRVRPNLYAFLRSVRKYGITTPIWIDAVCINQQDIPEKNKQVQMMGKIYSQATKTIVWLGLADEDSQALQEAETFAKAPLSDYDIKNWTPVSNSGGGLYGLAYFELENGRRRSRGSFLAHCLSNRMLYTRLTETPLFNSWHDIANKNNTILRFASNDYWRRAWIVQEIVLTRKAVLLCSTGEVQIANIMPLTVIIVRYMREFQKSIPGLENYDFRMIEGDIHFIALRLHGEPDGSPIAGSIAASQTIKIDEALSLTWSRLCADIKDRVFSTLSIANITPDFKVDYGRSCEDILLDLVRLKADREIYVTQESGDHLSMIAWATAKALQIRPPPTATLETLEEWIDKHKHRTANLQSSFFFAKQPAWSPFYQMSSSPVISTCFILKVFKRWHILECRYDAASLMTYTSQWWVEDGDIFVKKP